MCENEKTHVGLLNLHRLDKKKVQILYWYWPDKKDIELKTIHVDFHVMFSCKVKKNVASFSDVQRYLKCFSLWQMLLSLSQLDSVGNITVSVRCLSYSFLRLVSLLLL